MRSGGSGVQSWLSTVSRPSASTVPWCVTLLAFSGTHSSVAGTHSRSTRPRKSSSRSRFRSGSDMSRMISASSALHSTSVCPWNMVRTIGRWFPPACAWHVNRNPIMSPISLMWCVGMTSTRLDGSCSMLWHVTRSSSVSGCSAYGSSSRGWAACIRPEIAPRAGYICWPALRLHNHDGFQTQQ